MTTYVVKFSKLRNPTGQYFQSKKQQSFCTYISAVISNIFVKIDYISKQVHFEEKYLDTYSMEEQAELIKYSAKTKSNLLKQPFVINMLMKRKEIHLK